MDIKDIYRALSPLKNRMHLNIIIKSVFIGLIAVGAVSLVLAFISLLSPIPFLFNKILVIYATAFIIALVVSLFLRPGNLKVAEMGDSLGLKERLITAWQLRNEYTPLAKIQRSDALREAENTDFKALYPVRFPKKESLIVFVLVLITALSFSIPSVARDEAAAFEKVSREIGKQAKKLDNERKELKNESNLSKEKLEQIDREISGLLKALKKAKTEEQVLKALSRTTHELDKIKNRALDEEMKKLAERLSNIPAMKELGDALKSGDMSDIKQKVEKLNEMLEKLDTNEANELAEKLGEAAQDISKDTQLAQDLSDLGQALASGSLSSARDGTAALGRTFSRLSASEANITDEAKQFENIVLAEAMESLNDAKQKIAAATGDHSRFAGQEGNGDSEGEGGGSEGEGGGGDGGNGQGQGQGQEGGGGAGDGTTNKDAGYTGEDSGWASREPDAGSKKTRDYEKIYVPDRLGDGGNISQVKGNLNNEGESQWSEAVNVPVKRGDVVPYNEVLEEYKNEAMTSLGEAPVPPVMKDVVRDYFTSLE
jgi:hypothetical protein